MIHDNILYNRMVTFSVTGTVKSRIQKVELKITLSEYTSKDV